MNRTCPNPLKPHLKLSADHSKILVVIDGQQCWADLVNQVLADLNLKNYYVDKSKYMEASHLHYGTFHKEGN